MPLGMRAPLANIRQAQYALLLRQRAFLQQIVHQTTHSLARFFLEVDANYKQFKTARGSGPPPQQRLEAQRAFYEEGRITIDRYLDAVSQYASAVAQEAQFKTSYNISIVALEEAKGTLLAYDNIAVAEGPAPAEGVHPGPRPAGRPPAVPDPARTATYHPRPVTGPPSPRPGRAPAAAGRPAARPAPPLPAPVGPLGPPPTPVPPAVPAGEAGQPPHRPARRRPRRRRRPRPHRPRPPTPAPVPVVAPAPAADADPTCRPCLPASCPRCPRSDRLRSNRRARPGRRRSDRPGRRRAALFGTLLTPRRRRGQNAADSSASGRASAGERPADRFQVDVHQAAGGKERWKAPRVLRRQPATVPEDDRGRRRGPLGDPAGIGVGGGGREGAAARSSSARPARRSPSSAWARAGPSPRASSRRHRSPASATSTPPEAYENGKAEKAVGNVLERTGACARTSTSSPRTTPTAHGKDSARQGLRQAPRRQPRTAPTDYVDCYYIHGITGDEHRRASKDPAVKAAFEALKKPARSASPA